MKILTLYVLLISALFSQNLLVGKFEKINFVDFNLSDIKAKIDTGAKTSSLHCSSIEEVSDGEVAFVILDESHKKFTENHFKAKILRIGKVRSSNGKSEKRYFIKTKITIVGKEYFTEFSLTDRTNMRFPVLIGRSLLKKGFYVDVSKEYTNK